MTKTGNYRYWSVIGLIVNKLNEEVSNAPDSIRRLMNEELENLDETSFGKVKTFLKDLWDKAISLVKEYLDKAFNWIGENLRRLLIFLNIIPEVDGWSDVESISESNSRIDYMGEDQGTVAEIDLTSQGVDV